MAQEVDLNLADLMSRALHLAKEHIHSDTSLSDSLNVLVAGGTGTGKSTLINVVFGAEVARTGQGAPITQQIKSYSQGGLIIYDTKGLELKDFEATKQEIANFLEGMHQKEAKDQIHIAWLCIQEPARRIQEGEVELYGLLKAHQVPTIVTITKAQQDKDDKGEKFSSVVQACFELEEAHLQRVRALEVEDDEGEIKPIMGIDKLMEKTQALLAEGQKAAFKRKQKYDLKLRRQQCKEDAHKAIVGYTTGAATIGATPIPFSDFALLAPTQIAMIVHISKIYGLELSQSMAEQLLAVFAGVLGVGYAVRAAVGGVLKFIPVAGSVLGGMISATAAAGTTALVGKAFVAYLDANIEDLEGAIKDFNAKVFQKYLDMVKAIKSYV
ncbi:GTP-binding protein [Helicobacter sp. NHP19-012]|uniref:GTP-binding protein n=1 Tax=Helicobacter gastrofelis TaxID=2849642 RepID=A0ABM7SH47_9HELI|nr:DUF697 domain-containing protein [Helicobacter sp. NHP19-012]BCZ19244.1 GTP-binding protein [Helicobacter sp. NHP19-012]